MKNSVKFHKKSELKMALKLEDEVEFLVRGMVSKIYHKPKDDETVFVVTVYDSELAG